MLNKGTYGISINKDAVEKIVAIAALEVEGVASLSSDGTIDVKRFIRKGKPMSSVVINLDTGAVVIDVFVSVKQDANPKTVAEAVQENVKNKVQDMTGNAVAEVYVHICDVEFTD